MNMVKWKKTVLDSPHRRALPIMTHPGIEMIGRTINDAVTNGEIHFQAIHALDEQFHGNSAAANIIMDLTVEAEAFGSTVRYSDHEIPTIVGRIVSNDTSINELPVPDLDTKRIPQYLTTTQCAVHTIDTKPVFAGCIGPFSLAGRLFDISEIMTAIYVEPGSISLLIEKCTTLLWKYIAAFKSIGANGVIIAEPAAGLLSEELCDEFSSKYIKMLIEELQDDTFLIMLHNCGNAGQVTQSMISTGAAMLHFGNQVDIVQTLMQVPVHTIVLGNLDPVGVFKMKSPEEVYASTMDLLSATRTHKNFIISSGCDIPPGVSIENINAFFHAVSDFNRTQ